MKAPDFDYARPETLAEALALLADPSVDAQPLAGGQSLAPMMNFRMAAPERLIDLNRIDALVGVTQTAEWLRIGAMTRYAALERDPLIEAHAPLLRRALPHIAHLAIRQRGTIGGSLALADPAAEAPAIALALGGAVLTRSSGRTRRIAADAFFRGAYDTALAPGELIEAIELPKEPATAWRGFYEIARRHGDYAMAGIAMAARNPSLDGLRVVGFAIGDRPIRLPGVEAALTGRGTEDAAAADQAVASLGGVAFEGDLNASEAMKRHLTGVALRRALAQTPL